MSVYVFLSFSVKKISNTVYIHKDLEEPWCMAACLVYSVSFLQDFSFFIWTDYLKGVCLIYSSAK